MLGSVVLLHTYNCMTFTRLASAIKGEDHSEASLAQGFSEIL